MKSIVFSAALLLALGSGFLSAQTAHAGATIQVGTAFLYPNGVAVDSHGNVFVADTYNYQVEEIVAVNGLVSASSTVNVIGSGFNLPDSVAVDEYGNVFVTDRSVAGVKEIVAVNGVVSANSTVNAIGSGFIYPAGVAVDGYGNVFVADEQAGLVDEIVAVNGLVSASSIVKTIGSGFVYPAGVAVDGYGNVFVVDAFNSQVEEIFAVFGSVYPSSPVIQIGSGFGLPNSVAVDGYGDVFVAVQTGLNTAVEIVANNGGASTSSSVHLVGIGYDGPAGVAVDGSGNVFVANTDAGQILETLSGSQKFPTTAVGGASAVLPVYFTFDTTGTLAANPFLVLSKGAPNLDFQPAATQPSNVCVSGQTYNPGDICAVNVTFTPTKPYQRSGAVQLMGSAGTPIATYNLTGVGTGPQVIFPSNSTVSTINNSFSTPAGVAVDGSGNVFVADRFTSVVSEIVAVNGVVSPGSAVIQLPSGSGFRSPSDVAVDASGNVIVADRVNKAIKEIVAVNGTVSASSEVVQLPGGSSGFFLPTGVAVDGNGNVFVVDQNSNAAYEIMALNGVISPNSAVNQLANGFNSPSGIAVDGSGNVFVADTANNAIKEIVAVNGVVSSNSNVIQLPSGSSGFNNPYRVAVDGSGNVFVADNSNFIQEILAVNGSVSPASSVITLPASGLNLASSQSSNQAGIAVDSNGNLFVTDVQNSSVRQLDRSDPPALAFANTAVGSASSDSPQSLLFANSGNATLAAVSPGLAVGVSFKQVAGSGTPADCTALFSLAPGGECNLSISFVPAVGGQIQSAATFTDNALNAKPSASQIVSLAGISQLTAQTVTFTGAPAAASYQSSFTVMATTNSGAIPILSASGGCSIAGNTVTMTSGIIPCQVTAKWPANGSYSSASLTQRTAAQPATPTVTFTGAPASALYQSTFLISATTNASSKASLSASGACSLSGTTVTMTSGTGTCFLGASWIADSNFYAASLHQTTAAAPARQTVNITAIANPTALNSYPLSATSTTGGTPAFHSNTPTTCAVSNSSVSLIGTGICTLAASVPATSNYQKGSATYTFTVAPPFTITTKSILSPVVRGTVAAFVLNVQSLGVFKGNVTLSCAGGPAGTLCADFPMTVAVNPRGLAASGFLAPRTATPGNYTVTFTGISGSLTATAQAQITVK